MSASTGIVGTNTRPRVSREFIEDHRRLRYVEATAEILHEFGRGGLSVTAVVQLARTARNTFYELFTGLEDCIAYGIGLAEIELLAGLEAPAGEGDWLRELGEAIGGFFDVVVARPLMAELFLIHSAGSRTGIGRAASRSEGELFVPLLRRGRVESDVLGRRAPAELFDECLSRMIVSLAARRVMTGAAAELPKEAPGMAALIGGFYLGPEAAERIRDGR